MSLPALHPPAKINLFLAIRGKDETGYHEIETVFAKIPNWTDELILEPAAALQIEFIPSEGIDPKNNTLAKAIQVLEAHTGRTFHYKITVHKNIPPCSGLGGAASDAATLLLALNDAENLQISQKKLLELGAQVGMDVPFFLSGFDVALGTHYGKF
ncbi:hypothetical protein IPG41_04505 [Candidatus Peregrinibacteria bacterium]|nr:MAG: hypothetical protein IPG41_04505 [Candidatus Peregrinibacteria bacterium]